VQYCCGTGCIIFLGAFLLLLAFPSMSAEWAIGISTGFFVVVIILGVIKGLNDPPSGSSGCNIRRYPAVLPYPYPSSDSSSGNSGGDCTGGGGGGDCGCGS